MSKKCEFCGAKISKSDTFCKECGMIINKNEKVVDAVVEGDNKSVEDFIPSIAKYIIIAFFVVLFIFLLI